MARVRLQPSIAPRRKFFPLNGQQNVIHFHSGGQEGVSLHDAFHGNAPGLEERDNPMYANFGQKIGYVIQFFAERYQKQKHAQRTDRTITRAEAAKQVAEVLWTAMQEKGWMATETYDRLRGWYLVQLVRIGKATFACVLEYDASVVLPPAAVGDGSAPTSYESTRIANAAVPSKPSQETLTVSSSTGTDFPPIHGSPRARSDADALAHWQTQPMPPEGPWGSTNFADLQPPHSCRATADNAVWPDTQSSSMPSFAATKQGAFADNIGQYNAQPIPSTTAYDAPPHILPNGMSGQDTLDDEFTDYTGCTSEPDPFTPDDTALLETLFSVHPHTQMANEGFGVATVPALQSATPPVYFDTTPCADWLPPLPQSHGSYDMPMDSMMGMSSFAAAQTSCGAYPAHPEMHSLDPPQYANGLFASTFEDSGGKGSSQLAEQSDWEEFHHPCPSLPVWGDNQYTWDDAEAEFFAYMPDAVVDPFQFSLGNIPD